MQEYGITAVSTDGIGFIKRHPEMFLQQYEARAEIFGLELATKVAAGALALADKPVTSVRRGDWWIIYSEGDWLANLSGFSPEEAFSRIIPLPEAGDKAI